MNITYLVRDNGACGYHRMVLPHETLRKRKHNIAKIEKGDTPDHIMESIDTCDVFVCARPNEPEIVDFIQRARQLGKKIVIDYDDNLFSVSPMSVHYQEWGIENVEVDLNGKKLKLWEDGKNFSISANKVRLDSIKRSCESADLISVTQPILAEVYSEYGKVVCLPNCLDLSIWKALNLKRNKDDIRLYWSGGASHYEDWAMVSEAIKAIMDKYKNATLVLLGMKFEGTIKGIDKVEYHHWVPTPAYSYKSAILDADIAIIPLADTEFNRSKSNLKLIEQGALSVPAVISNIPPYEDFHNGNNGVFIDNNSISGWVDGISYLIDNPLERWNMGGEAYKTVHDNYDITKNAYLWELAYKDL